MTEQQRLSPIAAVICVPTFRRVEGLRRTLQSVIAQRSDVAFAVVVVDNDGADPRGAALAREMLATLCVGRLEKTRHYIEIDGLTWEVDEFANDNAGLVVAEIELTHADQPFARPAWLGRELTQDRRYYNHHLALHPWKDWPDEDRH